MTANEKRFAVIRKYEDILGRNKYSQKLRDYCYKKYRDGKYYSDCSSSVSYAYKEAGYAFGILNTVGMYQSNKLTDVPVEIENGIIRNPEVLRIGDMLLFAGTDSSRAYAGYVGHVEMVAKIENGKITIYGHGSGTPRATEMNAYCKSRQAKKSDTGLGHRGLIRVRRFIQEDSGKVFNGLNIAPGSWNVRRGPGKEYPAMGIVQGGSALERVELNGWMPVRFNGEVGFVGPSAILG